MNQAMRLAESRFLRGYDAAHHLADKADDVLDVVGAMGVGVDAAALVFADLMLVDDPIQGAAVAEAFAFD